MPSKEADVGQMRSSKGTSRNRMRKDEILHVLVSAIHHAGFSAAGWPYTHRQRMLKAMRRMVKVMRLAMPRAKHKIMHMIPHLYLCQLLFQAEIDRRSL